jgi:hypothetical protein
VCSRRVMRDIKQRPTAIDVASPARAVATKFARGESACRSSSTHAFSATRLPLGRETIIAFGRWGMKAASRSGQLQKYRRNALSDVMARSKLMHCNKLLLLANPRLTAKHYGTPQSTNSRGLS